MEKKEILEYIQGFMTENRVKTIRKVINQRTKHFTVVVEDPFQSHNASAILRSCDIFGIQDLNVTERLHQFNLSTHVAKGADKWVDVHSFNEIGVDNTQPAIDAMRKKGYQIIATSPHYGSTSPMEFDITKPSAIFFGQEKEGLSKNIIDQADGYIKIPMYGFTESLNISSSVAIILQSIVDKLKNSDVKWELTDEEKFALEYNWSMKSVKNSESILEKYLKNNQDE
ncbi:MAG: RNA methyltransferase [Ichthyobacteriaceae bacterium]|nr:RNA methyltransferase [Ichthyobacteriaceae bacterium]